MIADTIFISDLLKEFRIGRVGPARKFFAANRAGQIRTTIISAAELAIMFPTSAEGWEWLARWKIYQLHPGVAQQAAGH